MSQFGSSVRDPDRETKERLAKEQARQMDIRALHKEITDLRTEVSELRIELGKRDGALQMLTERLGMLEKQYMNARLAKVGSGPSSTLVAT